jgi:hypothetical protein
MKFNITDKFLILLFLFSRFISFSQFFPSVIGGDSISYRLPPNTERMELPTIFTYFPETLFGNSLRPFFPVSFFFLAGSDNRIVFFQSIFAVLCWAIFLVSLIILFKSYDLNQYIRYVGIFLVIVIISNQQLLQFDRLIYSESLAFSSLAIYLSGIFLILSKFKDEKNTSLIIRSRLILLTLGTILLTTTKTAFVVLFGINLIILFFECRYLSKWIILRQIIVFTTSFIFVYLYNSEIYEYRSKEISYPLTSISYYLSLDNALVIKYLENYQKDNSVPRCAQIDSPFGSGAQMLWGVELTKKCPEVIDWAESYFATSVVNLFKSDPIRFTQNVSRMFLIGQKGESGLSVYSIFPSSFSNLVFASEIKGVGLWDQYEITWNRVPRNFNDPYFLFVFLIMSSAVVVFKQKRKNIITSLSERFVLVLVLSLLLVSILTVWLIGILVIPGPAGEIFRLASIPNISSRILLIIVLSVMIDELLRIFKNTRKSDSL